MAQPNDKPPQSKKIELVLQSRVSEPFYSYIVYFKRAELLHVQVTYVFTFCGYYS